MSDLNAGPCADACISGGEGEQPELCGTLIVKAHKPQKCCECHDPINPGDRYEVVSGKWEGEWMSFKTCLPCKEIRETFCCDGWTFGMLWTDAEWFLEEMTTGCLDKLESVAAKEKLTAEWRRHKGLSPAASGKGEA